MEVDCLHNLLRVYVSFCVCSLHCIGDWRWQVSWCQYSVIIELWYSALWKPGETYYLVPQICVKRTKSSNFFASVDEAQNLISNLSLWQKHRPSTHVACFGALRMCCHIQSLRALSCVQSNQYTADTISTQCPLPCKAFGAALRKALRIKRVALKETNEAEVVQDLSGVAFSHFLKLVNNG